MVEYLKKEWNETKVLFRCMPTIPFAFLVACLIAMNFLANRGGAIGPVPFDCGIIVSWVVFLASDMLVKRFGAKAAIKINIAALLLELVSIGLMTIGAMCLLLRMVRHLKNLLFSVRCLLLPLGLCSLVPVLPFLVTLLTHSFQSTSC